MNSLLIKPTSLRPLILANTAKDAQLVFPGENKSIPTPVHVSSADLIYMGTNGRHDSFMHVEPIQAPSRKLKIVTGIFAKPAPQTIASTPQIIQPANAHFLRPQRLLNIDPNLHGSALLYAVGQEAAKGHRPQSYNAAKSAIFSSIDQVMIDGVYGVYSAYSEVFVPGKSANGSDYREHGDQNGDGYVDSRGMNIEHLWPQSYFNKHLPMKSDVHHLFATFMHPNGMRSRLPFGEVDDADVTYRTSAGAKMSKTTFEPPKSVKGQIARALLYFYARYIKSNILPSNAVDTFWNDSLPILMKWNIQYPPKDWERERNNRIEKFQGNRNPFVDDPLLAERIGMDAFYMKGGSRRVFDMRYRLAA